MRTSRGQARETRATLCALPSCLLRNCALAWPTAAAAAAAARGRRAHLVEGVLPEDDAAEPARVLERQLGAALKHEHQLGELWRPLLAGVHRPAARRAPCRVAQCVGGMA